MQHIDVILCVDRTLKDILNNDYPFGGIMIIFCGDWQQILPVVHRGGKPEILQATLKYSEIWEKIIQIKLSTCMRNKNKNSEQEKDFIKFQKSIGNGSANVPSSDSVVQIPGFFNFLLIF